MCLIAPRATSIWMKLRCGDAPQSGPEQPFGTNSSGYASPSGVRAPHEGDAVPYRREGEIVLALWRNVERDLAAAEPGSPEADALQSEAARLPEQHRRLTALAIEHNPSDARTGARA
jgi:hypothetical protein